MDEALALLLRSLDTPDPILTAGEVARWPAATLGALEDLGLLRVTGNASYAACPSCECGHVEEVVACDESGTLRFYIPCPESLRVEINPSDLRQWTFDWHAMARLAARQINLRGSVEALIPDRVWRLGRQKCDGLSREFMLARGLLWPDGAVMQRALGSGPKRVLLVGDAPSSRWWPAGLPAVIRIEEITSGILQWDLPGVANAIRRADRRELLEGGGEFSEKKRRVLRRPVLSREQFDEVAVQTYRHLQSYREVAKALNKQGHKTDRWAVERAINRRGGIAAVMRRDDTRFEKPVVSRRRDRPKKS